MRLSCSVMGPIACNQHFFVTEEEEEEEEGNVVVEENSNGILLDEEADFVSLSTPRRRTAVSNNKLQDLSGSEESQ